MQRAQSSLQKPGFCVPSELEAPGVLGRQGDLRMTSSGIFPCIGWTAQDDVFQALVELIRRQARG